MSTSKIRAPRVVLTAVAIALFVLSGCGGSNDTGSEVAPEGVDTAAADDSGGDDDGEVPPPDNGGDDTSVNLPSAPIGGTSIDSSTDPRIACASVSWIASATIPSAGSVVVSGIGFNPDVVQDAGSGCEDQGDSCQGFTFTSEGGGCVVAVERKTGASSGQISATVEVDATAHCEEQSTECADFLDTLRSDYSTSGQSYSQVGVTLLPSEESPDESDSGDDQTGDDGGSDETEPTETSES